MADRLSVYEQALFLVSPLPDVSLNVWERWVKTPGPMLRFN